MQDLGYDDSRPDAWNDQLISGQAEANNKRSISRDNVYSMARDVWAGDTSFQDDFDEFDLTQILAGADEAGENLMDDADGELDGNTDPGQAKEYVRSLVDNAKKGELEEEQFTLLQGLISEWMLMKQERNFKQGQAKKYQEIDQSLTRQATSVSIAERNRRRGELSVDGALGQ
jgi:hypothetical protein